MNSLTQIIKVDDTKPFVREDVFEDLIRNRNAVDAGLDPAFKEEQR